MHPSSVANKRIQKRSASTASSVVAFFVAEDHEFVFAAREAKLIALDTGEGLKGRARRSSALRAMAIERVTKFIANAIFHVAAGALAFQFELRCRFHEDNAKRPTCFCRLGMRRGRELKGLSKFG